MTFVEFLDKHLEDIGYFLAAMFILYFWFFGKD